MTTSSPDDNAALVTGASGDIGAALTRQIATDGYDFVLTAQRERRLTALAQELEEDHGVTTTIIPKDLADPGAPPELFKEVRNAGIDVHTLVNVAGFPVYSRFNDTPIEEELEMMQVNMVALTHLTKLFAEPMVERGDGAILNVASLAAYAPMPRLAVYAATKAYVLSFS
jgi:short-subunit dehydrogenase